MGDYKELNIGEAEDETEFDFIIEEVADESDTEGNKEIKKDDGIKDEKNTDKDEGKPSEPKTTTERKPGRAEKRIKELHRENKEKDLRLEAMAEEIENLKKNQSEASKVSKVDMKTALEASVENLNSRLLKAMEEGDTAATVKIQNELLNTSNKLFSITKEIDEYRPYEPKKVEQKQQTKVSEKALQWVEENPDFKTDEIFNAAALAVNRTLLNDGWDPDSDEFYEEVTERLKTRFPDKFGTSNKNSVELETDTDKSSSDKTKNKSQRHAEQTVSGASRTPSTSSDGKPSTNKKNTITLTAEDIKLAKRWNMTPEQFAKRKLAIQNKDRGDYIEINTGA